MAYKKVEDINQLQEVTKSIDYIAYLQIKFNLSRADIARYLGVNVRTFNDWCTGLLICPYPTMLLTALNYIEERGGINE